MKLRKTIALVLAMLLGALSVPAFDLPALAYNRPYYIEVDLTNQIITIHSTQTGNIVRQFLCSSGDRKKEETPTGIFYLPQKKDPLEREYWYYFSMYGCYAHYATRVFKGVLFHSIPYSRKDESTISLTALEEFGRPASHGCMRLRVEDAEFIAKCCLAGTRVHIYHSNKRDETTRMLLMEHSYTNEKGISYDYFMAISDQEGALSNGSEGSEVRDLQTRLRDLGIFGGEIDGVYGGTTINAVRDAQRLMGEEETGVATPEFLQVIYSNDAPTDTNVTITEGMSGPAVRKLQQQLKDLQLYDSDIDGVFDVDVLEAAKRFQAAYAYPTDGVMVPQMLKALQFEANKVNSLFGESGYDLETTRGTLTMAHTTVDAAIRLRAKPDSGSQALASLTSANVLIALDKAKGWSYVQRRTNLGYVRDDFLKYYTQEVSSLTYTAKGGDTSYTIGYTPKEYMDGVAMPWEVFATYLATDGSVDDYEGTTTYARVDTDGPDVTLNLREKPGTDSAILAEVPYQTQLRVLLRGSEWSYVEYKGMNGYLLNQYLTFWGGEPVAVAEDEDAGSDAPPQSDASLLPAVVRSEAGGQAAVYDVDSEDATVLGHLNDGIRVEVVSTVNGWSHIRLEGHDGYMKDADLQFMLAEET